MNQELNISKFTASFSSSEEKLPKGRDCVCSFFVFKTIALLFGTRMDEWYGF
jgi:hypothetical protein